jgi:hypothetical protein
MFRNCPNLDRLRQLRQDKQRQEADDLHASLQVGHAVRSQHQTPGVCSLPLPRALFWRGVGGGEVLCVHSYSSEPPGAAEGAAA